MRQLLLVFLLLTGTVQAGTTHGNLTREGSDAALRQGGVTSESRMYFYKITNNSGAVDTIVAVVSCIDIHPDPTTGVEFRHWKMGVYDADTTLLSCTAEQDGPYIENTGPHWQGALIGTPVAFANGDSVWGMVWCDTLGQGTGSGSTIKINTSGSGDVFYYDYDYTANSGACPDPASATSSSSSWDLSMFLIGRSNGNITIYQADVGVGGDAQMTNGGSADRNFGGEEFLGVQYTTLFVTTIRRSLIEAPDLVSWLPASSTIDSCSLTLNCDANSGDSDSIGVYQIVKPPVEGTGSGLSSDTNGATWNDWDASALEWGTAGADAGSASPTENTGDGTGDDRDTDLIDKQAVTVTGDVTWDIGTTLAQGWYDGDFSYRWVILDDLEESDGNNAFNSSEQDDDNAGVLPRWYIEYSGEAGGGNRRRKVQMQSAEVYSDSVVYVRVDSTGAR